MGLKLFIDSESTINFICQRFSFIHRISLKNIGNIYDDLETITWIHLSESQLSCRWTN